MPGPSDQLCGLFGWARTPGAYEVVAAMETIAREQIIAFRLERQCLSRRAAGDRLLEIAAPGIQNTPPTSAVLAFSARLRDFAARDLELALNVSRSLIQIWCLRAAPYVIPTADLSVFTAGLAPDDESACLYLIRGAQGHLQRFSMSASQVVEYAVAALPEVLASDVQLTKDELGVQLADRVASRLSPGQLRLWRKPDGLGKNTFGQSLVRYALSVVSLHGLICLAPMQGSGASHLTLAQDWLGRPLPVVDVAAARAELVRRFLRYQGPGTTWLFAEWAGVAPEFARDSWRLITAELEPVKVGSALRHVLAEDVAVLRDAVPAPGVRLLPPHDPFLAAHDKRVLAPDGAFHARIWRRTVNPGAVLVDGAIAGIWHPKKQGKRLTLTVTVFQPLAPAARAQIAQEAALIGIVRGAEALEVEFGP